MTQPRGYLERQYSEDPPIGTEQGSSFKWDQPFGGWEDGKVFALPEPEYDDYKEMLETDGKAAGLEILLSYPIISAPWQIEPFKGDKGQAEFIWDALTDLPHQGGPRTTIEQLISQMTTAFTYKRAYFEKVYKVNQKDKVVYDKIAWRPYETCEMILDDATGDLRGFRQYPVTFGPKPYMGPNGKGYVDIPMERAFIYVHGTWRDPLFGFSSMKVPYWCYITKRKLRWLWYQFLDQTYLPKTIVKNPDETQAVADARKVAKLRSRGVVGLSSDTTVEPHESGGFGSSGYIEAIRYLESEMSNAIMAGFSDLTSAAGDGKGSFALAENATKLYMRTRRMVARDMARYITNDIIGPLIRYNYGPKAPVPRFAFGALSEQNEQAVLDMFRSIATTGAKVDPEFYDELQTRVAALLELDAGKVGDSLRKQSEDPTDQTPGDLQKLAQQVDIATNMVSQAQANGDAPASPIGPLPGGTTQSAPGTPKPREATGANSVASGSKDYERKLRKAK